MFSKRNLISTLVTAVWGYLGGWILWGMLMDANLKNHLLTPDLIREMPDMVHLIIGCIIVAFVFSTLYSKWAQGNYTMGSGLSFGIWMGIFLGFGLGLVNMATMNFYDITGTLLDGVTYVVFIGVMGLLAGLVYQKTV
jgi:ABC-type Mn2+/Zn2+ transport system permease subunit